MSSQTTDTLLHKLIANVSSLRGQISRISDPRRDIDDECGYQRHFFNAREYWQLYEDDPIAARVVEVMARQTWQTHPTVRETENEDVLTPFEEDWGNLNRTLRSGSWYQQMEGSLVADYLSKLDIACGIAHYGVMYMGFDDGGDTDPATPVVPRQGMQLRYLRVFPEHLATITATDDNKRSERYGQPTEYELTFANSESARSAGIYGTTQQSHKVHWSRILHVADNIVSSEVYGIPRLQQVRKRVIDLQKLYSGSAEMYWRGAFPGIALEGVNPPGAELELDESTVKDKMEAYMNGLQRYLLLVNIKAKPLAPQVVDPTPQIMAQIQAICIKLGIPMRVFMGTERGELASSQDDAQFNDELRTRQRTFCTPHILVPFIDRLIRVGVLRQPKGYSVVWPSLDSQSGKEKATIAFTISQAIATYANSQAYKVMPPYDFFTMVMGYTDAFATACVKRIHDIGPKLDVTPDPALTPKANAA